MRPGSDIGRQNLWQAFFFFFFFFSRQHTRTVAAVVSGFNAHASCIFKPFWYSCTWKLNPNASPLVVPLQHYSGVPSHPFSLLLKIKIQSRGVSRDSLGSGIGVSILVNVPQVLDRSAGGPVVSLLKYVSGSSAAIKLRRHRGGYCILSIAKFCCNRHECSKVIPFDAFFIFIFLSFQTIY